MVELEAEPGKELSEAQKIQHLENLRKKLVAQEEEEKRLASVKAALDKCGATKLIIETVQGTVGGLRFSWR